ncbi:MAG: ribosome assembly RNA-binding protein YhbY [Persicimonas sp.]
MEQKRSIVKELSPALSGKQRRHLRALGHDLDPVVMVGQRGVSQNLIENLEAQLLAHELVKVKVHDADALDQVATELCEATGAQLAQQIGGMLLLYKPHPEEPTISLPQ